MPEAATQGESDQVFAVLEGLNDGREPTSLSSKGNGALFSAYEQLEQEVHRLVGSGCAPGATWSERVRDGLAALLCGIAARPALAVAATHHFPALGPEAYRRYDELLSSFVPMLREGREHADAETELPDEVELMAIGAGESLIFAEIDAGNAAALPAMLGEILFSVLVPFIGPERAVEEMELARAG
jgi:hypothetical protein